MIVNKRDVWYSLYVQIVMDQLNPGLRNLVNLGKSYEKAVTGTEFTLLLHFHQPRPCFIKAPHHQLGSKLAVEIRLKTISADQRSPYTLMFLEFAFPRQHQMLQLVRPDWATNSVSFSSSLQRWPSPGRPTLRRCQNWERMPLFQWCPGSSVSFRRVQVLLWTAGVCSHFHANVNARLQLRAGWFTGVVFFLSKSPSNSLLYYISCLRWTWTEMTCIIKAHEGNMWNTVKLSVHIPLLHGDTLGPQSMQIKHLNTCKSVRAPVRAAFYCFLVELFY